MKSIAKELEQKNPKNQKTLGNSKTTVAHDYKWLGLVSWKQCWHT